MDGTSVHGDVQDVIEAHENTEDERDDTRRDDNDQCSTVVCYVGEVLNLCFFRKYTKITCEKL